MDEPGEHEFYVILHPLLDDPDPWVKSNTVRLRVEPVPEKEAEALADYRRLGLGRLVQSKWEELTARPGVLGDAELFLRTHADSAYERHVRRALIEGLRIRGSQGSITPPETDALRRLEAQSAGH